MQGLYRVVRVLLLGCATVQSALVSERSLLFFPEKENAALLLACLPLNENFVLLFYSGGRAGELAALKCPLLRSENGLVGSVDFIVSRQVRNSMALLAVACKWRLRVGLRFARLVFCLDRIVL